MDQEKETQAPKKPRKKLRRLMLGVGVLVILGFIINGPTARWLVLSSLDKQLSAQGMQGTAKISGSLMSGFSLEEISYSGTEGIQLLKINRLTVDYRIIELINSKIRSIKLDSGTVVVDIAKFPETAEDNSDTGQPLTDTLQQIQPWVSQPAIKINQLEVTLLNDDEQQAHIMLESLNHEAGSSDFSLQGLLVTDRTGQSTPAQNVQFVWLEKSIALDHVEIMPDISLENVKLDWKSDLQAEALLYFLESKLSLKIQDSIDVQLSGGSIDSEEFIKRFKIDIPGSFVISGVDAHIKNWQASQAEWNIEGELKLNSASYENYRLTNSTIRLKHNDAEYTVDIDGELNTNAVSISLDGSWFAPDREDWWAYTEAHFKINAPKIGTLGELWKDRPAGLDLSHTSVQLDGKFRYETEYITMLEGVGKIQDIKADSLALPPISITADHLKGSRTVLSLVSNTDNSSKALDVRLRYDPAIETYEAQLGINESKPAWINALARVFKLDAAVKGPVRMTWSGSGAAYFSNPDFNFLEVPHDGRLEIKHLDLKLSDNPSIKIISQLDYKWPNNIHLKSLNLQEGEWNAMASMQWDGQRIQASSTQLTLGKELVASLSGSLPYHIEIQDAQSFFDQTKPWDLSVKSQPIALTKIREWFDINLLNQITGSTELDVELSGSPKNPQIKGQARATNIKGLDDNQLLPLDVAFDFHSKDQTIIFEGSINEGKDQRLKSKGSVPFTPSIWMKDPDWISQFISTAPVIADITINELPLARFEKFVPGLKKITGTVTGEARLTGTIEKPIYSLNLDADVPLIQISESSIGDIRNIKLNTRLDQTQQAATKLTAEINGGKFEVSGNFDLNDFSKPLFDFTINTRYALVHRDDLISVRANTDLRVKGSLDDATISGNIGIVESLFYKDIELIPIGVPSSAVATVKLPALSSGKAEDGLPIPAPFSNWKLDLTLRTDDPILIRGNVASGNLSGSLKVGGTLTKPMPEGTVFVNRVKAKLPFSILDIERGQIIFNGRDGLNPSLKITGKSTVGSYDVSVFIYGPASSPKTTFSSFPPLPESEVMTLLATGTTTSNLENRSVATFKAFQLFLLKLKQRNDKPNGNRLFKNLLTGVEDLNLNVGEVDPFTGRKFASGTVEIHPRWNLTAQVDDTQQTRGLIVYVLRFR